MNHSFMTAKNYNYDNIELLNDPVSDTYGKTKQSKISILNWYPPVHMSVMPFSNIFSYNNLFFSHWYFLPT